MALNLPGGGRWYRGNLHAHSLWSDGMQFPELAARAYRDAGTHFLAFTEHDRFQTGERWLSLDEYPGTTLAESGFAARYEREVGPLVWRTRDGRREFRLRTLAEYREELEEPERFLLLNGEEVSVRSAKGDHWLNVIGGREPLPPLITEGPPAAAFDALTGAVEAAFGSQALTCLNHPNYLWNAPGAEVAATRRLGFMEIHTALNCCQSYGDAAHPGAEAIWDEVLAARLGSGSGAPVYGLASDDCHAYYRDCTVPSHESGSSMPGRAWVMVAASCLSQEAIVTALRAGRFYASSGVGLSSIEVDGSGVRVRIEAREGVGYRTRIVGTRRGGPPGAVLGEAEGSEIGYRWRGDELYVRMAVASDRPHPNPASPGDVERAWTQPMTGE